MPEVGVVGLGSVGWSVIHGLSHLYSYAGYDIADAYDWEPILGTKIVFVGVSTPMDQRCRLDCEQVNNVLGRLTADEYRGLVVVKSTVSIGFMDAAARKYPGLRMVIMPEFLRERSSYTWFTDPDRIVVGGEPGHIEEALHYFEWARDAEVIRTDFRSAEMGKLAHNSFIATKVSFTNEMEKVCEGFSADPEDVMRIVWTDRRLGSGEHLTPGMGPYGGKCVPKDMNELINASGSQLLQAVRKVNEMMTAPEQVYSYEDIVVMIPTLHRAASLERALASVANQTYRPKSVLVIGDDGRDGLDEVKRIIDQFVGTVRISYLSNGGTNNLSGAINTGLGYLTSHCNMSQTYLALLDDDDWWDRRYLENCMKFALETGVDWVVSGLIRHDESNPKGAHQTIPEELDIPDFLVSNPNIQDSNMFIRASNLEAIGGFDENLRSTTDRDVGIRLLRNGTTYGILRNHLAHHDASEDPTRLSHPGSEAKRQGLTTFFYKYKDQMTEEQRVKFRQRAKELFAIEV